MDPIENHRMILIRMLDEHRAREREETADPEKAARQAMKRPTTLASIQKLARDPRVPNGFVELAVWMLERTIRDAEELGDA